MIIFLLLIIVAILLFGASAVLGVAGQVLGLIALIAGLWFLAAVTGITFTSIFLGFCALIFAFSIWVILFPEDGVE